MYAMQYGFTLPAEADLSTPGLADLPNGRTWQA